MKGYKKKVCLIVLICMIAIFAGSFLIYTQQYYRADADALAALESDGSVEVSRTVYGWLFDGPSESDALIFYPGAKVEETAYAPLLHLLAEQGMDVCLVKMPFRLAFFGIDKADRLLSEYNYENWYIGGHSLGGAMAAAYAADHGDQLAGVALLAAYATKELDDRLAVSVIYGSQDGVLNMEKVSEGEQYLPETAVTCVLDGGNHAQFGNYGRQKGDGDAFISAEEQQRQTVEIIIENKREVG